MVYDCGSYVAKYVLCSFNFLLFLSGSIILSIGIWIIADSSSIIGLSKIVPVEEIQLFIQPSVIHQASYVLIAIGGFLFVASFLGYCGALRESQCMLTTYGILLLLLLVAEIGAVFYVTSNREKVEEQTKKMLKDSLVKYYSGKNESDAVTVVWDQLQANFKCCGVDNYEDFDEKLHWSNRKERIPASCCVLDGDPIKLKPKSPSCTNDPSESNSYYNKGCYESILEWSMANIQILSIIYIVLMAIEVIGIFFACCLTSTINSSSYY